MSAVQLATLALEVWRSSGPRTQARLSACVERYAESYFGPAPQWAPTIRDTVRSALVTAQSRTRPWEMAHE